MKKFLLLSVLSILICLSFSIDQAVAQTRYWVGGTGNWSNTARWSTSSGGAPGASVPTAASDVLFDANSFTSAAQTVTIDVAATCLSMNWTGATNSPTLAMSNALTVSGSLTFIAAMSVTSTATITFNSATAGRTVTTAGKTLTSITFSSSVPATGSWVLQDALTVSSFLVLTAGTLNTAGQNVTCNNLSVNSGSATRVLTLGNSAVTISGGNTTVLDFRGNGFTLTTPGATASITFTSTTSYVGMYTGSLATELPNLVFNGYDVDIHAYDYNGAGPTPTITFRNITMTRVGTTGSRNQLFIGGNCPKVFGSLTLNDWTNAASTTVGNTINSSEGTPSTNGTATLGTFNNSTFNGPVTFGINCLYPFNGNNTFNAAVSIGASSTVTFSGNNTFASSLTTGTSSYLTFSGSTNTFSSTVTTGSSSTMLFSNSTTNSYANVNHGLGATWSFSAGGQATVSGTFTTIFSCGGIGSTITSSTAGSQANVSFSSNQTLPSISVKDIRSNGVGTVTVKGGQDVGNNTNLIFNARVAYWVPAAGNSSGTWDNTLTTNWSNTSGGAGGACPPSLFDNAIFDNNSFTSSSQLVTLGAGAACRNLTWAVTDDNSHQVALGTNDLTINGSLSLDNSMTVTSGNTTAAFVFTSPLAGQTITTAGRTLPAITFNSSIPATGAWTLQDALTVTTFLYLQAGNLTTNSVAVKCRNLNAYGSGDLVRSIDLGNSIVTLTGTVSSANTFDLRGNNLNFITPGASAKFVITGASVINEYLVIYTGGRAKELPDIDFGTAATPTTSPRDIDLNTENGTERITFRKITLFRTDGTDFYIAGSAPKTYGDLSFGNNMNFLGNQKKIEGTDNASPNNTIFNGTVTFGNNCLFSFYNNNTFNQAVTFGSSCTIIFNGASQFNESVTVGSLSNVQFNQSINFPAAGTKLLSLGTESTVNVGIIPPSTTVNFTNVFNDITLSREARIAFYNGTGTNTIRNLTLQDYTQAKFNPDNTTTVTGTLSTTASCGIWISMQSSSGGTQAPLTFSTAQIIQFVQVKDLNISTSNLTNNTGVDQGNNVGINYGSGVRSAVPTLYWVGGTTGNSGDVYWSSPKNWALSSGVVGASNTNTCIPSSLDDAVFDANSFTDNSRKNVIIDLNYTQCKNLTFSTIATGVTFDNGVNNTGNNFAIFGNLTFHANVTNYYEGLVTFASTSASATVTSAGRTFLGPIEFVGGSASNWTLQDALDVNAGTLGDISITTGTLTTGTNTINLEGDWVVRTSGIFNPGATTNVVTLDGGNYSQEIRALATSAANSYFRSLTINKTSGNSATLQQAGITITNNLSITAGTLVDNGYQITGNSTGLFTMGANTSLYVGSTTVATTFPTFTNASQFNLDATNTVSYTTGSFLPQTVRGLNSATASQQYGHLIITGSGYKSLDAATTIRGNLTVNTNNEFIDAGFQITGNATGSFNMGNCTLTLGSATSATTFPTFTNNSLINMGTSVVVYNAGVDQVVRCLNNNGSNLYYNLILRNSQIGTKTLVNKSLDASAASLPITNNLIIEDYNNFIDNGKQISRSTSGGTFTVYINGKLTLGSASVATTFPTNFSTLDLGSSASLASNSEVIYNAGNGVSQTVLGLSGSGTSSYANLTITNASGSGTSTKTLSAATTVRGNLTINTNNAFNDAGFQVTGNSTGVLTLGPNTSLTVGSASIGTTFPTFTATIPINLDAASTVIYNAGNGWSQTIRGLGSATASQQYGNLTITNGTGSGTSTKTFGAAATVRGNLTINGYNTVNDAGYQITGNSTGLLTMAANTTLTLGTTALATTFPTFTATIPVNLDAASTVIYNAGSGLSQTVLGFNSATASQQYGHLTITNASGSGTSTKTLSATTTVRGNFTVNATNTFLDNGNQLSGIGATTVTVASGSTLTLGNTTTGTSFPTNVLASNVSLGVSSTVVYNGGVDQTIRGLYNSTLASNLNYGNLTLTNPTTTQRTKTLDGNIGIRGNLTVNGYNTLDASNTNNYAISLQGNWISATNAQLNAQLGTVTFEGSTAQSFSGVLTSPNSLYNLIIKNSSGVNVVSGSKTITNILALTSGIVTTSSGNILTMTDVANNVSGGSASSYVSGPMAHTVTTSASVTKFFPLGKAGAYRPATLILQQADATSRLYTGEVNAGAPPTRAMPTSPEALVRVSGIRYTTISQSPSASVTSAILTLTYGSDDQVTGTSSLRIAKGNGASPWVNIGGAGSASPSGTITSSSFTSFSDFALATTVDAWNPLPVRLVTFKGKRIDDRVVLDWQTASEKDNVSFEIQRSAEGTIFEAIGTVRGAGTTNTPRAYQLVDTIPLSGTSYYRLKQMDIDDRFEYSPILSITSPEQEDGIWLFPNPMDRDQRAHLRIHSSRDRAYLVLTHDARGREVARETIQVRRGFNECPINQQSVLLAGLYTIQLLPVNAGTVNHIRYFKLIVK